MFHNWEEAIAFLFEEMGIIKPDVALPQKIRTILYKAWQSQGFAIPKALISTVMEMLRKRLSQGTLEPCHGPYRYPWFLDKKKEKGKYWLINAALNMNKVTIRDANFLLSVDEFSEDFAGCVVASLVNFFSGDNQASLAISSQDLTAF